MLKKIALALFVSQGLLAQSSIDDARGLILKAHENSTKYDFSKKIEDAKKLDTSQYNLSSLKDTISKQTLGEADLGAMVEGFAEVIAKDGATMNQLQQITGIASVQDAKKRQETMDFLGISEARNHMYIFISYSMPEDMIKAYAREALWSGASLIIKGLKEGETFKEFINKKAKALIENKGYTAALHFDPRLYDAFEIDYVPTIVIADENHIEYCDPSKERVVEFNKTKKCKSRPSDRYIKISGAVTLDYALEQFIEEGTFAKQAQGRLDSLRENIGKPDYTEQKAKYDFDDKLLPHQKEKIYSEYSKFGNVIETEHGISVVPFAPPERTGVHFKRKETK